MRKNCHMQDIEFGKDQAQLKTRFPVNIEHVANGERVGTVQCLKRHSCGGKT